MKIIHMSDLHLSADGALVWEEDCRRKFLTAIKQIKMMRDVDAIIVSGDISNDGSLNSYYFADRVFSVTTQHPIENFSLIKHKLDFAYFHHHYKLFND